MDQQRIDAIKARCEDFLDWLCDGTEFREIEKRGKSLAADATDLLAEVERLTRELEAANARWEETASDGTDYTLTHSDGIYAVADSGGHVLCEFMRGVTENGGAK